jgi:hypothetical protein
VYLGYSEGVRRPVYAGPPLYGKLMSEWIRGMAVLHLWPYDFPLSARAESDVQPLATLWRPEFSGVMELDVGFSGLECRPWDGGRRWFAQRWMCEPMTFAAVQENLQRSVRA